MSDEIVQEVPVEVTEQVVVEQPQEVQAVEQPVIPQLQEPVNVVTTLDEQSELVFAKELKGNPVVYDVAYAGILKSLVERNIAADFGAEGHGRGYKWEQFCA